MISQFNINLERRIFQQINYLEDFYSMVSEPTGLWLKQVVDFTLVD